MELELVVRRRIKMDLELELYEEAKNKDIELWRSNPHYDSLDPLALCNCGGQPTIDVLMALINCDKCGLGFEYRFGKGIVPYYTWQLTHGIDIGPKIGMFSISNAELDKKEPLGSIINCPHCYEDHEIKYGEKIMDDGTKAPSTTLAYYKCKGKIYLAGIDGKKL